MARRTWIKVRRGILDPKHRRSLGAAWHLYLYMLDRADWEDGIIYEWIDSAVADELEMNLVTLRFQRRHLETEGYIETSQNQYSQSIRITKYIDPREEINEGYNQGVNQGYNQGVNQGDININTPTLYSNNQISHNHINREEKELLESLELRFKQKFQNQAQWRKVLELRKTYGIERLNEVFEYYLLKGYSLGGAVAATNDKIATWGQRARQETKTKSLAERLAEA